VTYLHVDADDLWIYEQEYGLHRSAGAKSIYDDALPRLLDELDAVGARATIFIVGKDLEHATTRDFCRTATARGHELANHTYSHPPRMDAMSRGEKEHEILAGHDAIANATGVEPLGFRSPGYYLDADMVEVLGRAGYLYDTSVLPTLVLPLMKLYIDVVSRRRLDKTFGRPAAFLASRHLRRLRTDPPDHVLYELPISVFPGLRLPLHSTFAFHFPAPARRLAYTSIARARDSVFLFHAIDGTDYPKADALSAKVLPLRLPLRRRVELIREALARLQAPETTASALRVRKPESVPTSRVLP
jgi:peptidoglycan/xylan/chitin deacetylase (PgdA/CDA1 family)